MQRQVIRVVPRDRKVVHAHPRHPAAEPATFRLAALVNDARYAAGLQLLVLDAGLSSAARVRISEIAARFAHERPEGDLADLMFAVPGQWSIVGENIAWVEAPNAMAAVETVHTGLMASPGHRANVLKAAFCAIGVGADRWDGRWYFVQLFAG